MVRSPPPRRRSALRLLTAQIGYQLRLLVRSPIASFATLVIPLMVLLAVNLLFSGTRLRSRGDIPFVQFFTPAMVAFAVVNACYMAVISSTTLARDEGILQRIRSTPLPPSVYMAGRIASAGAVGLLASIAVVAVGAGVYGFDVVWSATPAALLTLAVAMFCFCALGLAVTALVPGADSALPIAWGTILPLCFVSDVFQPIDNAPGWLQSVASFFPLRPFADDLERMFNPVTGSTGLNWCHLGVLAAWGVIAAGFALVAFRWQPVRESRGSGTSLLPATFSLERLHQLLEARPLLLAHHELLHVVALSGAPRRRRAFRPNASRVPHQRRIRACRLTRRQCSRHRHPLGSNVLSLVCAVADPRLARAASAAGHRKIPASAKYMCRGA